MKKKWTTEKSSATIQASKFQNFPLENKNSPITGSWRIAAVRWRAINRSRDLWRDEYITPTPFLLSNVRARGECPPFGAQSAAPFSASYTRPMAPAARASVSFFGIPPLDPPLLSYMYIWYVHKHSVCPSVMVWLVGVPPCRCRTRIWFRLQQIYIFACMEYWCYGLVDLNFYGNSKIFLSLRRIRVRLRAEFDFGFIVIIDINRRLFSKYSNILYSMSISSYVHRIMITTLSLFLYRYTYSN